MVKQTKCGWFFCSKISTVWSIFIWNLIGYIKSNQVIECNTVKIID